MADFTQRTSDALDRIHAVVVELLERERDGAVLYEPPERQLLGRASANGDVAGAVDLPRGHNRWRVHITPDATITAGDVAPYLEINDPQAPSTWRRAGLGAVPYAPAGGQVAGALAPIGDARIGAQISAYAGAGKLHVILETWHEG